MKSAATLPGVQGRTLILLCLLMFAAVSGYGQTVCDDCPTLGECSPCAGGLTSLKLRYDGALLVVDIIAVDQDSPPGNVLNASFLTNTITITKPGGVPFVGNVTVSVFAIGFPVSESATIVTSCSPPVFAGQEFGNFVVLSGASLAGPLCCSSSDMLSLPDPVFSNCPGNINVALDVDQCSRPVSWTAPTATQSCGGPAMLTSTHNPGATFPLGTTLVQYTATDDYGNTSTCSFNVTVTDNTNPVITDCPNDITVSLATSECSKVVGWTPPTVDNDCVILTSTHNPGDSFPLGTTQVTYVATDAAGNISTCSFNVVVTDTTIPLISGCPANINVALTASECSKVVSWTPPTVNTSCVTLTSTHNPGDSFPFGTTEVIYTAKDAANNISTCSFNVTVTDNTNPIISGCPSDITVALTATECSKVVNWVLPTVNTNCVTLTSTHSPGHAFPFGTTQVVYTATDAANNVTTCSFNVTVTDNTNPVISGCPGNITIGLGAVECSKVVSWTPPTVNSSCVTLTSSHSPGDSFPAGTTQVTYTAKDAANNISTCSFNVVVMDNTNPIISGCPSNITVALSGSECAKVVNWTPPVVDANCVTLTSTHNPGSSFSLGTTQVVYTATDAANNASTCSFNVTVTDNTNPIILDCPTDITVSLGPSECSKVVGWTPPTVDTSCTELTSNYNPGSSFPLGTTQVTYVAKDAANNISTCSFNVTVIDNTNPVISGCPGTITVSLAASECSKIVSWTPPTVNTNCVTLTSTHNPNSSFPLGTTEVIYTAKDAANNISTCSFNVVVVDNTNPIISGCPSDINVSLAATECSKVVTWTPPTVNTGCVTLTSNYNPGDAFPFGTTQVTYTAKDAANNISICSFNVVVTDNTNPIISGCPSDINVSLTASECSKVVTWTPPTVNTGCVTLTSNHNPGDAFPFGTTQVIYTAKDAANNISTCSFNVVVTDNSNPVISGCPSDINVSLTASECSKIVSWTPPVVNGNCITLTSTHNPGDLFSVGTTQVTYTATDAANNISTCSFNVIVRDNTPPVISGCLSSQIVSIADESCEATVTWTAPTATDNCGNVNLTSSHAPGDVFGLGTTTVTYTATDDAGNVSTCSFDVVVEDDSPPVIVADVPEEVSAVAEDDAGEAAVTWDALVCQDNCGTVTVTSSHLPGDEFSIGTTVVTYTISDNAGNSLIRSFNVVVSDVTAPVISGCVSDIVITAGSACEAVVSWSAPSATDNSGTVELTSTHSPGTEFPVGVTEVIYTAKDPSGNVATCSFNVTVKDESKPVFTGCIQDIEVFASTGCTAKVEWTPPTAADNCEVTLTSTHNPGDLFPIGTTEVTYTASDQGGNITVCAFKVIVKDNASPVISGYSDVKAIATENCDAVVTWSEPKIEDCSNVVVTKSHSSGDTFPIGSTEVTYTVTDEAGNVSTCKFNVVVEDKTPPVFSNSPQNITARANTSCNALVNWQPPIVTDNCEIASVTSSHDPGTEFPKGVTEVVYKATDIYGNESYCKFEVSVQNEFPPVISGCVEDIHVKAGDSGEVEVSWIPPTSSVQCGEVIMTSTHSPGDLFPIGTTTVEYKATDNDGNVSVCAFNVHVSYDEVQFDIVQVITPDGDGINDQWILGNIEKFSDNKVVIVDRWGGVIFSATGYNNESIVWRGTNSAGTLVPTGTYFYTITVRVGTVLQEKKGFIELLR